MTNGVKGTVKNGVKNGVKKGVPTRVLPRLLTLLFTPLFTVYFTLFFTHFAVVVGPASAQVSPDVRWRTIRTDHFQVHYSPGLEENARRAAVNAERAYAQLAAELVPPRGPLDLVIADNVDFTNGYATPFPTNRIVIYTHPPVSASSLRFYDEWSALVITHELTHIFQLDRARGWWRLAQRIFGRSPPLMPHAYTPSWLNEGLAVYYESRLTGSGRLVGSEHRMIARAAAMNGTPRRLDELSQATSRYPGGQSVYVYGSLLFDHLARTQGAEGVPKFVERISAAPFPFFLNRAARRSFGIGLEQAWRQFQDSLARAVGDASAAPMPGWRELTTAGREAHEPRWLSDSSLVYSANTGRETAGAYSVDLHGRSRRISRRNGMEPNTPLPGGGLLFAQLEYVDPYRVRSDLYIEKDGRQRRLTHGARLSSPDARDDGTIVAVQAVPGTTRLVRVTANGDSITPLTTVSPDTQWTEPRWSPDGSRIVAVRRVRDGHSAIVLLNERGDSVRTLTRSRSVEGSPSWSSDGQVIYFSSDRSGSPQVYAIRPATTNWGDDPFLLSQAATGLVEPEAAPTARSLASVLFRADGYHIGVAPLEPMLLSGGLVDREVVTIPPLPPLELDTTPSRRYSPWRTLLPRYWLPTSEETGDDEVAWGGLTSGSDVIGRHSYSASLNVATGSGDIAGGFGYGYAGLGNPVLGASFSQFSDYDALYSSSTSPIVGYLRERSRVVDVSATLLRPRYRTGASLTIAAELERIDYSLRPETLRLTNADLSARDYAAGVIAAAWANTQRPGLAISPEDGLSLSGTARRRWLRDGGAGTTLLVGSARAYKSLDLPGFAHHVLAARVVGAWASENSTTDFGIGGTSGSSIEIVPGLRFGDAQRTFGVRGFPADSRDGIRALGGSVEYRAPLTTPARGWRLLPVFFDKVSLSFFGDAAAAWCPARTPPTPACNGSATRPDWIASAGGEINLDAALPYDVPYRFRLGLAAPLRKAGVADVDAVSLYFTLGYSF